MSLLRLFALMCVSSLSLMACEPSSPTAQDLIAQTILAHGGTHYDSTQINFVFRDVVYTANLAGEDYVYVRSFRDSSGQLTVSDTLSPTGFSRFHLGQQISVPDSMAIKYSNSINSVWYFALLPKALHDAAVRPTYLGEQQVGDSSYYVLKVTFAEEGGGVDFQDVYAYWINRQTMQIDYLGYSYEVDEGGLRFRKAYNRRIVGGITFQDYINYAAPRDSVEVPDLAKAYQMGTLKELSRIELEEVKSYAFIANKLTEKTVIQHYLLLLGIRVAHQLEIEIRGSVCGYDWVILTP